MWFRKIAVMAAISVVSVSAEEAAFPSIVKTPQLSLELVSEQDAIVPGRPFTLGLRIVHAPKYHTYWEYPGVVGLPTKFEWKLPPGFSASPIQWQRPELTKMGELTVYGYEGDTLLLVELKAPEDLKTGVNVVLNTRVVYMACAATCHPGFVDMGLELPVAEGAKPDPKLAAAFKRVRDGFAVASDAWAFSGSGDMKNLRLVLTPGQNANTGVEDYYFFDRDGQVDSDKPFTFSRDNDKFIVDMKRVDWAEGLPRRIRGILVAEDTWELGLSREAIAVDIQW